MGQSALENTDWLVLAQFKLGLPLTEARYCRGRPIPGTPYEVDERGHNLTVASTKGDLWRIAHDNVKHVLARTMRHAGITVTVEVANLFALDIPQLQQQVCRGPDAHAKRQGLIPDFLAQLPEDDQDHASELKSVLLELKAVHASRGLYPAAGRYGPPRKCGAVARRAGSINTDYQRAAAIADQKYCGTPARTTGPVERRLLQFGRVRGLVFGSFGEISKDFHTLMRYVARANAERHWMAMGALTEEMAQAASHSLVKRTWATAIDRENAQLLRSRMLKVGTPATRQPSWQAENEREYEVVRAHRRAGA